MNDRGEVWVQSGGRVARASGRYGVPQREAHRVRTVGWLAGAIWAFEKVLSSLPFHFPKGKMARGVARRRNNSAWRV